MGPARASIAFALRFLGIIAIGLLPGPWACAEPKRDLDTRADLRVLTLNLLTFAVDAKVEARTAMVIDFIGETQPDLIAMQEAAESAEVANRASVIALATGYSYVWTATEVDEGADYHGGPALLSRWPIVTQSIGDLPHLDFNDEVRRRAIFVTARMPFGDMAMVATHTTTNTDAEIKTDQSVAGAELLLEGLGEMPGIYAGDFNADPDSLAMRVLRGDDRQGRLTQNFSDAWTTTRSGDAGFTYPSRAPTHRLDYIYSVPGSQSNARAIACQTGLDTPLDATYASDHLALLCDFVVE